MEAAAATGQLRRQQHAQLWHGRQLAAPCRAPYHARQPKQASSRLSRMMFCSITGWCGRYGAMLCSVLCSVGLVHMVAGQQAAAAAWRSNRHQVNKLHHSAHIATKQQQHVRRSLCCRTETGKTHAACKSVPRCSNHIARAFAFLARTLPADSMAKPACMKKTCGRWRRGNMVWQMQCASSVDRRGRTR